MIALMNSNWDVFTQVVSNMLMGSSSPDEIARLTEFIRACTDPDAVQSAWRAAADFDVRNLLPQLSVPTLVMDRQGSRGLGLSRKLASSISDAALCILDSGGLVEWAGDIPAVVHAIEQFITPASSSERGDAEQATVRTVLFTDVVGHTEMMRRLGDERGRDMLREHERITREVLKSHGGIEVKTMGDGFMASFGSVTKGVECAIALQRAFDERNFGALETLHVRVGLNAGEPIEEEGDLFGASVILAARIAAKAEGGEILIADTVRGLCSGKGFLFADRGEFVAKGFEDPVRVYEVSWRD
jgi:class 3 adenylate cyclase